MLEIERERRQSPRMDLERPCKVFEPRSRKYIAGRTCNVTPGGLLLRLERPVSLEEGDRVYVGIAQTRRHALLRTDDMVEAEVVRSLTITTGETAVAVHFREPPRSVALPSRRAA